MINPKALNQFVNTKDFKIDSIYSVKDFLRQSRLERSILCHPHTPNPQKLPQVPDLRERVPLHMFNFWAVISHVGIHQDTETSSFKQWVCAW